MKVVITKAVPQELVGSALEEFVVVQGPPDAPMAREELMAQLHDCDGLVTWGFNRIDGPLLDCAPHLRIVANISIGTDNLDVAELTRRGVWATNIPEAFAVPTAEVAMGLLIAAMRRLSEGGRYIRDGSWHKPEPGRFDGPTLAGKRLGLVGFGRIAQHVAKRANAFDMDVMYHARHRVPVAVEKELQATWMPFDDLLSSADAVSLHVPLTGDTHHLIDDRALRRMKSTAYIINTARGKVVDEEALAEAVRGGRIAGAGLDVFEAEPAVLPPLLEMPNVVVTPHLGGGCIESRREAQSQALENVRQVLNGFQPLSPINQPFAGGGGTRERIQQR